MLNAQQGRTAGQSSTPVGGAVASGKSRKRPQARAMDVAEHGAVVVAHLDCVYRLVTLELDRLGMSDVLKGQRGFTLEIEGRGGEVTTYWATLRVQPGLGVKQPLDVLVCLRDGVVDVAPSDLARAVVAQAVAITAGREAHAAACAALRRATQEAVAEATREGLGVDFPSIEARPLDAQYSRAEDFVFDIALLLLGDERGRIEADTYVMDTRDADEFADYLRTRVPPEQRGFQARLAAGQAD